MFSAVIKVQICLSMSYVIKVMKFCCAKTTGWYYLNNRVSTSKCIKSSKQIEKKTRDNITVAKFLLNNEIRNKHNLLK